MKTIFKKIMQVTAISSALVLAACGAGGESVTNESNGGGAVSADIGVISWLSGAGAAYGEAITNGLKLAQEEINAEGEVNINLIIEDSAGKQDQALTVAQKLMHSENVTALIGPTISTEMNVVGPEADLNGVTILGTSITSEGVPQIGDYVFRNSIPEAMTIPAALEKAMERFDIKKVAIIYGNDDVMTKSGFEVMKKSAEEEGLEIVAIESFQKGQTDYNSQLTKIKNFKPDLVMASAFYNEGAVIMDQARKMGIEAPFLGGNGFNSPEVITIAGAAADGLIVGTPWFAEKDDEKVKNFVAKYTEKYGHEPDQFAAQAYDGLYLYAEALKNAGSNDRDDFRDALAEIRNYDGILGDFSFDEEGDVVMDPTAIMIENGKFVEIK